MFKTHVTRSSVIFLYFILFVSFLARDTMVEFWDCVVATRTHLGAKASADSQLTGNLGSDRDAQRHPGELESITQDVNVAGGKDQRNDGAVRNGRGP